MSNLYKIVPREIFSVLICIALMAGCSSFEKVNNPRPMPEIRSGILLGYLPTEALPNSLALLPPPPAEGTTALALDKDVSRNSLTLRGTPRWDLAAEDANLKFPQAAGAFSCALNAPISEQDTPHLYNLLQRTLEDALHSTNMAKNHYMRTRPFLVNQ